MKYSFQIIKPSPTDWALIEASNDSTCYQTSKWYKYLDRIGYSPCVIKVFCEDEVMGYFIGEKIWRGAILMAAPFEGIGTYTQGLVLLSTVSEGERVGIYKSLAQWLFDYRIASYLQVDDWHLRRDQSDWISEKSWKHPVLDEAGVRYDVRPTLHVALNRPKDELWAGLHYKSCKYCVNKARKLGLFIQVVERFEEIDDFVDVHYDQLCEVCQRHGAKPKAGQSKKRMIALCESLFPDRVIMLKVLGKDEDGIEQVMASGIFCIDKGECSYWTGASYQRYQRFCPNELMVWEAMQMMSSRGAGDLNFCGMANYKLKFGTIYAYVPRLIFTKHEWIYKGKSFARSFYYHTYALWGKIKGITKKL